MLYRDFATLEALDAQYNLAAAVPEADDIIAAWAADSATARESLDAVLGVGFGPTMDETLDIFPAAGVSACVELGRIRMPKAHAPWELYDQVNARGGFIHAFTISPGDEL